MIPDGKAIVIEYLNGDATVDALGARIASKIPSTIKANPWVRVLQLDARAAALSRAEHLTEFLFDLHCYASEDGGTVEASNVARTVRAALHVMPDDTFADVVVTSVRFVGMGDLPDEDFEPARDRVVLTAIVHMHPTGGGS